MDTHRFSVGDLVCYRSRTLMKMPDSFEVSAVLPPREGIVQYRIKSEHEAYERVVGEDDIEPVHSSPANNNIPAHLRS
ncbi:hypothetical protein [Oricola thermophila]|uniref:Uncharacterized protein n=1 Tax=Oricola thermophila TaxID=2742145 RepID=A0A6N1V956_9HYPH|nr:hypothetical protein [Oricola thermophila]QKV17504.1 hypothetical protein HTY61_02965 [Oricola thermophila]